MKNKILPVYLSLFSSKSCIEGDSGKRRCHHEKEDVMSELLKAELIKEICEFDLKACKHNILDSVKLHKKVVSEKARIGSFKKLIDMEDSIPSNLRGVTFCSLVKDGNENDWEEVWQKYLTTSNVNMKRYFLNALGCSKQIWILKVHQLSIICYYI